MAASSLVDELSNRYDLSDDIQQRISGMLDKYKNLDAAGRQEFLSLARDSLKDQLQQFATSQTAIRESSWLYRLWYGSPAPLAVAVATLSLVFGIYMYILSECYFLGGRGQWSRDDAGGEATRLLGDEMRCGYVEKIRVRVMRRGEECVGCDVGFWTVVSNISFLL